MASVLPQNELQPWTFKKPEPQQHFDSPSSDHSSNGTFESSDKLRVTPTMEDIRAALKEQMQPHPSEEYQSSEEALSPMLDDGPNDLEHVHDAEDEDTVEELDLDHDNLAAIGPFKIDMAIAICVIAKGKAKVVNIPPRWVNFRRQQLHSEQTVPVRSDSIPPVVPSRSLARTSTMPKLDTKVSSTSMPTPITSTSHVSISPDDSCSAKVNREIAVFSTPRYPTTALTPPISEHDSDSPSFLQSDPFENVVPRRGHFRLRSLSERFKPSATSRDEIEPIHYTMPNPKRQRRRSLTRGRPATPPSFFDNRSSDESARSDEDPRKTNKVPPPVMQRSLALTQRKGSRMVARGANEREPAIRLPPCPRDYDQAVALIPSERSASLKSISPDSPTFPTVKKSSTLYMRKRQSLLGLGARIGDSLQ